MLLPLFIAEGFQSMYWSCGQAIFLEGNFYLLSQVQFFPCLHRESQPFLYRLPFQIGSLATASGSFGFRGAATISNFAINCSMFFG
ncbi:hypothetical protein A0J61_01481 [Choanephora cucurbitarum]|uniref:Uncharacterized protein n=1 Tax=Choanephora cucurbitarum TaxID=101091 RepID=A0A1C7NMZ9_9FUNG|nr:hypothetical protein A0J61_01481 [Choanephora cucurbitarum]